MEKRRNYPNLRIAAFIFRFLAWFQLLIFVGGIILLIVRRVVLTSDFDLIILLGVIIMGITWLACYMTSELIQLVINVEHNTADSRDYLKDICNSLTYRYDDGSTSIPTNPSGKTVNDLYSDHKRYLPK